MLASVADLGYSVEWRVVNAADYGFPQKRRRVFIVGRLEPFAQHRQRGRRDEDAHRIRKQPQHLVGPVEQPLSRGNGQTMYIFNARLHVIAPFAPIPLKTARFEYTLLYHRVPHMNKL